MLRQPHRYGAAALAGSLGFALNLAPVTLLAWLWPGRIITLPIAILFGPWYGALAALAGAAAFAPTTPFLVVMFALEGFLIGAFARRGRSPLLVGTLLCCLLGATFALFPGLYGAAELKPAIAPLALQQLLNAMVAVVLADFIVVVLSAHRLVRGGLPGDQRLHAYAFHAFMLVATLPVLLLSTVAGEAFSTKQTADGGERLQGAASSLRDHIDEYLDTHGRAVAALAATLRPSADTPAKREQLLTQYGKTYPGFVSIRIADRAGIVRAAVPPLAGGERLSVADREFFNEALRPGRPTISDIVAGQRSNEPRVFVGAPVIGVDGQVSGVAYGVLSLPNLQKFIERYQKWPARCFIPVRMRVYITGNRSASDLDGGGSARLSAVGAGGR